MTIVPFPRPPDNNSAEFVRTHSDAEFTEINGVDDLVEIVTDNMRRCVERLALDHTVGRGCCLDGGVFDRTGRLLEFQISLSFTPTSTGA